MSINSALHFIEIHSVLYMCTLFSGLTLDSALQQFPILQTHLKSTI